MDKAPRKRIVIREEPVTPVAEPVAPEPEPVAPEPEPKKRARRVVAPSEPVVMKTRSAPVAIPVAIPAPVAISAPLSPRTLFRQAGETIYALQNQRETARRDYWAQQIGKSLR